MNQYQAFPGGKSEFLFFLVAHFHYNSYQPFICIHLIIWELYCKADLWKNLFYGKNISKKEAVLADWTDGDL